VGHIEEALDFAALSHCSPIQGGSVWRLMAPHKVISLSCWSCRRDPPSVSNGRDLRQWMCRVHNNVNRSLNKPVFNCDLVEARWSPLNCGDDENASSCDMGNWGLK